MPPWRRPHKNANRRTLHVSKFPLRWRKLINARRLLRVIAIRVPKTLVPVTARMLGVGREKYSCECRELSQDELGARSGYRRMYLGLLERGEKSPSLRTMFDIAASLEVRPSEIIR